MVVEKGRYAAPVFEEVRLPTRFPPPNGRGINGESGRGLRNVQSTTKPGGP